MKELTKEQAVEHYSDCMRRIRVGAYQERSTEDWQNDTWPEDGVEESIHNLDRWALKQGLSFHWIAEEKVYKLEPMLPEEIATYVEAVALNERDAQEQYNLALVEIDALKAKLAEAHIANARQAERVDQLERKIGAISRIILHGK